MGHSTLPSPKGLPIFGNMFDIQADTLSYYVQSIQTHGNLVRLHALGSTYVLVAEPSAIQEVLVKRVRDFPKEQADVDHLKRIIGDGLVTANGEAHHQQRRLAQPAFHARRIEAYADTMVHYTQLMLDDWQPGQLRDVAEEMVELTMFIVVKTLFDVDRGGLLERAQQIGHAVHDMQRLEENDSIKSLPAWVPTRYNRQLRQLRNLLDDTIFSMIEERRAELVDGEVQDRGDLLSMLLLAEDESGQRMSDRELVEQSLTIFMAGHETTAYALAWTFYLLSQHPAVRDKLHAELERVLAGRTPTLADLSQLPYLEKVLKESMRLYPPAWHLNIRIAARDTTLGEHEIERGTKILVSPWTVHRNPRLWPDPERFDPERFTPEREAARHRYAYLPFGGGPRICIGNAFATMEAQLILATVAQRFALDLVPGQIVEPNPQITISPRHGLKMSLLPREAGSESKIERELKLA